MPTPNPIFLTATGIRIRYENPDKTWRIVEMRDEANKTFTAVGDIVFSAGEKTRLHGNWETSKFGLQFKVESCYILPPSTIAGLTSYLTEKIAGIGPKLAEQLADHFGLELGKVLDSGMPAPLMRVKGISAQKAQRILDQWKQDTGERDIRVFLFEHGVPPAWHRKILDKFGAAETISTLQNNPYRLTRIKGIGFQTADRMAQQMGYGADHPSRLIASTRHVLEEATKAGHCYLSEGEILEEMKKLTQITDQAKLQAAIDEALRREEILAENIKRPGSEEYRRLLYVPRLLRAERELSQALGEKIGPADFDLARVQELLEQFEATSQVKLNGLQKEAVLNAFRHKLSILTGSPGSGKTTAVKAIIYIARRLGIDFAQAAPTGRAARRMHEVSGIEAKTIHRLLGWTESGFQFNRQVPLPHKLFVVDESSMPDLVLFRDLVSALADEASIVLVGDPDQLPAVGPGTVLHDLIRTKLAPTVTLEMIYRQGERSLIISNAYRIKRGEAPEFLPKGTKTDSYVMHVPRKAGENGKQVDNIDWLKEALTILVKTKVAEFMSEDAGFDPIRDIQVLSPMKKGGAGVEELNQHLGSMLNPDGEQFEAGGRTWRIGDRVKQTENDYKLDVSNGDIGFIQAFDPEEKTVTIDFYHRRVDVPAGAMSRVQLAYCSTIHSVQGSEAPVVIIVMLWQHRMMLERTLLYTANTRARKLAIYLTSPGVLKAAAENNPTRERNSFLANRLRAAVSKADVQGKSNPRHCTDPV